MLKLKTHLLDDGIFLDFFLVTVKALHFINYFHYTRLLLITQKFFVKINHKNNQHN